GELGHGDGAAADPRQHRRALRAAGEGEGEGERRENAEAPIESGHGPPGRGGPPTVVEVRWGRKSPGDWGPATSAPGTRRATFTPPGPPKPPAARACD